MTDKSKRSSNEDDDIAYLENKEISLQTIDNLLDKFEIKLVAKILLKNFMISLINSESAYAGQAVARLSLKVLYFFTITNFRN